MLAISPSIKNMSFQKKPPSSRSRTSDLRIAALLLQLQSSALPTELSKDGYEPKLTPLYKLKADEENKEKIPFNFFLNMFVENTKLIIKVFMVLEVKSWVYVKIAT